MSNSLLSASRCLPNLLSCAWYVSEWQMNKIDPGIRLKTNLCSWNMINWHAFKVCLIPFDQMTIYKLNTAHSQL